MNEKVTMKLGMKLTALRQGKWVENHLYVHSQDNMAAPTSDVTAVWTNSEQQLVIWKEKNQTQ